MFACFSDADTLTMANLKPPVDTPACVLEELCTAGFSTHPDLHFPHS